jgi:hypothetical protein
MTYKETAKKLGIKYRIGKYGFQFLPKDPNGKPYKLLSITPLDGWLFDDEMFREMQKRGFEL